MNEHINYDPYYSMNYPEDLEVQEEIEILSEVIENTLCADDEE